MLIICSVPEFLEDQYLQMTSEFSNILTCFVNRVCKKKRKLKDVKTRLVGIAPSNKKEISEVHDEIELMGVLRNYCSLTKFPILTSLTKDMNMPDIFEKLNKFEEKKQSLYQDILAKDFARSVIEYCGTMNSREVRFIFIVYSL